MVLVEICRYVTAIVVSPPYFIPFFIYFWGVTLPCDVSGFQGIIYEKKISRVI